MVYFLLPGAPVFLIQLRLFAIVRCPVGNASFLNLTAGYYFKYI